MQSSSFCVSSLTDCLWSTAGKDSFLLERVFSLVFVGILVMGYMYIDSRALAFSAISGVIVAVEGDFVSDCISFGLRTKACRSLIYV